MKQCNESGKMRQKWDIPASGTKVIGGPYVWKLLHKFICDNLFISRPNKRSGSVDVTKVWPLLFWSTNIMGLMADKELESCGCSAQAQPRLRCEATLWQFLFPVSFDKQSPVAAGTSPPHQSRQIRISRSSHGVRNEILCDIWQNCISVVPSL